MQSRERRKRKPQEMNGSCRAARRRRRGRDCNKRQVQCSIAAAELSWCFSRVSVSSCRFARLRAALRAHAAGHVFIAFLISSAAVPHRALRVRRACMRQSLFASFPFLRSSLSFVSRFVFRFPPCPCSHPPPALTRVVSRGEGRRASRSPQTSSRGLRRLCRFSRVSASFSLRPCFLWLRCSLRFVCLRAAACSSRSLLCVSFVCSCSGSVPLAMPLPALVHLATLSSYAVPLNALISRFVVAVLGFTAR